jgi:hypothetical protein
LRERKVGDLRDGARRVLELVDLEQVFSVNSSYTTRDRTLSPPFRVETQLRVLGRQHGTHIEVWARYVTEAFKDVSEGESTGVWSAEVEYVATFGFVDGIPTASCAEEDVEAFALLVGTPAIHPYAREHTQAMTGRSQYPAFTLGLLNSLAELPDEHVIQLEEREDNDPGEGASTA